MAAVTHVAVMTAEVLASKMGKAAAALAVGKPVVIDAAAQADPRYPCTYKAATAETTIHGVVIKAGVTGGPVEVLCQGELDGFSGLTPGAPLSVAAGVIDDTAPTTTNPIQLIALSATRIWVKC